MATTGGRQELERLLIQKAWRDPDFREQIANDPKGTIEKHLSRKLPEDVCIFVHLEDEQSFHFILPPKPEDAEGLSGDDLERSSDCWQTLAQFISGIGGGAVVSLASHAW